MKKFWHDQLKLVEKEVQEIGFERVHRIGQPRIEMRAVVAKFSYFLYPKENVGGETRKAAEEDQLLNDRPVSKRDPGKEGKDYPDHVET